jgi:hypothetical protein
LAHFNKLSFLFCTFLDGWISTRERFPIVSLYFNFYHNRQNILFQLNKSKLPLKDN